MGKIVRSVQAVRAGLKAQALPRSARARALAVVALVALWVPLVGCASDGPDDGSGGAGSSETGSGGAPPGGGDGATGNGSGATDGGLAGSGGGGTNPSEPIPEEPSAGCNGSATPPTGAQSITVGELSRTYIVSLPDDYDPSHAHPLVFAFHGLGGSGELVSGQWYFGIEQAGGKPAIFVYPDGLDAGDGAGWPNEGGRDVAFFDALLKQLTENYCVDEARVFSTGHSYGGMMTHTLACQRGDLLRGVAPVAGAAYFAGSSCTGPVAFWGAHGDPDEAVDYEAGVSAMERLLETNGCDEASATATEPAEYCARYACDSGYPVTWCPHDQNHDFPDFAAESIKSFIDSF